MRNKDFSFLLKVGLALCLGMILRFSAFAQCENGYSTHTFDTALTSNGFGMYTLTVPQWHPDSGTLLSVKVSTAVTSQYEFTLRNADNQSATYNLTIGQEDIISGAALSSPVTSITNQYTNNYPLSPGQSITDGPFPLMNNHITSDSITDNIVPFLGAGNVTLSYMSFTYTGLNAVNSATYYYSSNINNNMDF